MVLLKRRGNKQKPLKLLRTGGYVLLLGIFISVTLGVYAFFNPSLFLFLINISQYEATLFFLDVYLPSFVIIVALGYVFVTTSKLEKLNLWRTTTLCTLILLCLTLSALSILNFLSFIGGLFVLTAVVLAYTKPTFKALWKREACFFVEAGTILTTSGSMLFLLMWLISRFLRTYSPGIYEISHSYAYVLLVIGIFSLLTFILTPLLCMYGANKGFCGIISLATSMLSLVTVIQNRYIFYNLSTYQGIFLLSTGAILTFCGALIFIKLFLSEAILSPTFGPSFFYQGNYCPYCGESWKNSYKDFCSNCKRSLHWESKLSYCPYCGRLVPGNIRNCPHCGEPIESPPVYIKRARKWVELKRCEEGWYSVRSRKGEMCLAPLNELTSLCDISEEELLQLISEATENGEIQRSDLLIDEYFELIKTRVSA